MISVYAGDYGIALRLTVRGSSGALLDLTGATLVEFLLRRVSPATGRPEDTAWIGAVADPPAAGVIEYVTQAGDLAVPGAYAIQGRVAFGDGARHTTTPVLVTVVGRGA